MATLDRPRSGPGPEHRSGSGPRRPAAVHGSPRHGSPGLGRLPADATARLLLVLVALGGAAALLPWWQQEPEVSGAAGWLTGTGQLAGLLAGYTAAVLLLLMARAPALERGVGADRLARWHAAGGRYLVGLIVLHVTTVVWGYALTDHRGVPGETAEIVLHYPDMLKATAGTLLLFGTGLLSARAIRRRLPYEGWYYAHLTAYPAFALTFAHQLANGADLGSGWGRGYWYALYFGAAAAVGWFRLARPWLADRRHRLRVAEVRPEAPGVVSVFLTGRHLRRLRAEPGQFFRLQFRTPELRWTASPYSLSAPVHGDYLRFTVKDAGRHSGAVARLAPGTPVRAEGPYGAFTARRRRAGKVLLLGAGVGITPLRALFETLPAAPGELTLLYRAGSAEELVFRQELEAIAAARRARLHYLLGARADYRDGEPVGPRTLTALVPDLAAHDVYLCGPQEFTAAAVRALRAAGVPGRRIHHESFAF